jgi:phage terminase large subunit-like protein
LYVVGKPVRLACERHLRDIEEQSKTGMKWKPEVAQLAILFFAEILTVEVRGEVCPFNLEPFQKFIVGSVFGWENAEGKRRFRTAYVEIGKGNGKTPLAAGIGLYGLVVDQEASPEIYAAATMREQANICFKDAAAMVSRSEELRSIIQERVGSLYYSERNGVFRPISSEKKGLDGKRVHMALIDEVHEHPTPMVCNKMRAGTKNRRNALIFEITNSGSDTSGVCWDHHEYSLKILNGLTDDPGWFAYVCALDEGDDWTDEKCWPKVNPGLGTILPVEYLREQRREALGMTSKQNINKRLNWCIWTQQYSLWIPIEDWAANKEPIDHASLIGRPCWVGIDLSDKIDLSVMMLVFRRPVDRALQIKVDGMGDDGQQAEKSINIDFSIDLLPFFFMPEDTMHEREREDNVPYTRWAADGFIFATPGKIIDYDYMYAKLVDEIAKKYSIQRISYDPRGATQFAQKLGKQQGFECVEVQQGFAKMSEPAKIFEALVKARRVRHGGNPVLREHVSNVAVKTGLYGDILPHKPPHSRKRIDGVTGAVLGLSGAMVATVPEYQAIFL